MAKQMRKGEKGSDPNNDPNGRDLLRRLRRRLLLVRQKTLHHLSLQSLIARHSGQRLTANAIKALTNEQLATYLDAPILLGGQITHQARCWLDEAISRIERELQQRIQPRKDYQLLQSIPAVARPPEVSRVRALFTPDQITIRTAAALWATFFVQTSSHGNKSGMACALSTPTMLKMMAGHHGRRQPLVNPSTGRCSCLQNGSKE